MTVDVERLGAELRELSRYSDEEQATAERRGHRGCAKVAE